MTRAKFRVFTDGNTILSTKLPLPPWWKQFPKEGEVSHLIKPLTMQAAFWDLLTSRVRICFCITERARHEILPTCEDISGENLKSWDGYRCPSRVIKDTSILIFALRQTQCCILRTSEFRVLKSCCFIDYR